MRKMKWIRLKKVQVSHLDLDIIFHRIKLALLKKWRSLESNSSLDLLVRDLRIEKPLLLTLLGQEHIFTKGKRRRRKDFKALNLQHFKAMKTDSFEE
jgi:hypothetical protein